MTIIQVVESPSRPPEVQRFLVPLVGFAAVAGFLGAQVLLQYRNLERWAAELAPRAAPSWARPVRVSELAAELVPFSALALAGVLLASRRRRSFALPALAWVLVPAFGAWLTGAPSSGPMPIGAAWAPPWLGPASTLTTWLGALFDLALVLAPATAMLIAAHEMGRPEAVAAPSAGKSLDQANAASTRWLATGVLMLLLFISLLVIRTFATTVPSQTSAEYSGAFLSLFLLGALLPDERSLAHALPIPLLLRGAWLPLAIAGRYAVGRVDVLGLLPFLGVFVLGGLWRRGVLLARRIQESPAILVCSVNALNLLDAVLTRVVIRSGAAVEANPVLRTVGLPMKVAGVAILTWGVLRTRPRMLIWPLLVLVAVISWHLNGMYLTAHS